MSSRDYIGERIVIWPVYIDSTKSRSKGRKLPRELCIPNPRVDEIVEAAKLLGLDPIVEEKSYPREWWVYDKRVVVLKQGSKRETLKLIAEKVKELRSRKRKHT